jgi:hypothetical protein
MRYRSALVFACAATLCGGATTAAPAPMSAAAWLARVQPLPATADAAYAQWTDISGSLKPGPAAEQVSNGIRAQVLSLERPVQALASVSPVSARDKGLIERISIFPDTAAVLQKIEAARAAQATFLQQWRSELNLLEQRRLRERSALPACHNDAAAAAQVTAPSQAAIRDVELSFATQKMAIAARRLAEFRPFIDQLLASVSSRIQHGDAAMAAWAQLRNPGKKAELAPVARSAESDALLDVALVQSYIQEASRLAARPVSERNALSRVYAHAGGC